MFGFEFKGFTDQQKGYLALLFGLVLLLNTLNIFKEWFHGILIITAILLIAYGVAKTRLLDTVYTFIQKTSKAKSLTSTKHEKKS